MAQCFPVEGMHTFFLNVAKQMAQHWSGTFFKSKAHLNTEDFNLSKSVWEDVGRDLQAGNATIPAAFCRTLRDISKNLKSFKAVELQQWVLHTSIIVLRSRLPPTHLRHWARFVRAMQLCLNPKGISREQLDDIEKLLQTFVLTYEEYVLSCFICAFQLTLHMSRVYYKYDYERLSACRMVFHHLLHVAECIRRFGPPTGYWSYAMERFIGILGPLVHSRVNPYSNLATTALMLEQLRQIRFTHEDFRLNPSESSELKPGLRGVGRPVILTAREKADLVQVYEHMMAVGEDEASTTYIPHFLLTNILRCSLSR